MLFKILKTSSMTEVWTHRSPGNIADTSHLEIQTSTQFTIRIPEMSSGLIASNPIAGLWAMITSIRTPCWPSRLGCDLKSRELTIIHHPPAPAVVWNANSPDLVLGPSPASRHWQKVWRSRDSLTIYCAPSSKAVQNPLVWGHFPVKLSRWGQII